MKMTTEEAFVKTLQMHGIRSRFWDHRLGLDADFRPVSRRPGSCSGTAPMKAPAG